MKWVESDTAWSVAAYPSSDLFGADDRERRWRAVVLLLAVDVGKAV